MLELPCATAMELMGFPVIVEGGLIAAQVGVAFFMLLLTQSDAPPAKIRLLLLGSMMKGEIKLDCSFPPQPLPPSAMPWQIDFAAGSPKALAPLLAPAPPLLS